MSDVRCQMSDVRCQVSEKIFIFRCTYFASLNELHSVADSLDYVSSSV